MCMKRYGVALDRSFRGVNCLQISHSTNEGPCYTQLSKFILRILLMECVIQETQGSQSTAVVFVAVA